MNRHLVARLLGMVAWLIGLTMVFSLPWAWPALGGHQQFELRGFIALVASGLVCVVVGWGLRHYGRQAKSQLFRKEAMAVVGLSWMDYPATRGLPAWRFWPCALRVESPLMMTVFKRGFDSF